ncbi:MAG: DUF2945 domain-containing protein [Bdellovibrio sp.]|nr:DUF2945 domain-containing protein [Bdellovibrio sp.]
MKTDKKSNSYKVGTEVQWKWMGRFIMGVVSEVHFESVSKKIKEKLIKRNGTAENPAYLVQSAAGNFALKLHSEVEAVGKSKSKAVKPTLFSR